MMDTSTNLTPEQIFFQVYDFLAQGNTDADVLRTYRMLFNRLLRSSATLPQSWSSVSGSATVQFSGFKLVFQQSMFGILTQKPFVLRYATWENPNPPGTLRICHHTMNSLERRAFDVPLTMLYPDLWAFITNTLFHQDLGLWCSPGLPKRKTQTPA